jgi:hypothetical protein
MVWPNWNQRNIDEALRLATRHGSIYAFEVILQHKMPFPSQAALETAVMVATETSNADILEILIEYPLSMLVFGRALVGSATAGSEECVRVLTNIVQNPHVLNHALGKAANNNHTDIVAFLLTSPLVKQDGVNEAVCVAASAGNEQIVHMLMNEQALKPESSAVIEACSVAKTNGHFAIHEQWHPSPGSDTRPIAIKKLSPVHKMILAVNGKGADSYESEE